MSSFLDQVAGELTLSQQRIGTDVFAFDVDGVQKRDGHLDLIGLLGVFGSALYRQGTDFFWV